MLNFSYMEVVIFESLNNLNLLVFINHNVKKTNIINYAHIVSL